MNKRHDLLVLAVATLYILFTAGTMLLAGHAVASDEITKQCKTRGYAVTLDGYAFKCQEMPVTVMSLQAK